MQRIVLATGNAGKLREFQQMLGSAELEFLTQRSLGVSDADETGLSFVENAILKARHAAAATGLPALADDSGLEVDALRGEPGIYSARYAGPGATDAQNNAKLLTALQDVPEVQRTARFICCIAFMRHARDSMPFVCHGSWEGRILFAPAGDNGFGYDPLFFVPGQGCSSAELAPELKNRISHRALAVAALLERLREQVQ